MEKMKSRKLWLAIAAALLPVILHNFFYRGSGWCGKALRGIEPVVLRLGDTGGIDLLLVGNRDRWDTGLSARHTIRRDFDLTARLSAGAKWGEPADWQGTVGMKWRW